MKKLLITAIIGIAALTMSAAPKVTFEKLDANKDGTVTKAEYLKLQKTANPKASAEEHGKWFKNIDKNNDGKFSKADWDKRQAAKKAQNQKKKKK